MSEELTYYRQKLDELTGQVIRSDSIVSRSKRELGQRRRALSLLSDLQRLIHADTPPDAVARIALTSSAAALKMDRTLLLHLTPTGHFTPTLSLGYTPAEDPTTKSLSLSLPPSYQLESGARLVTAATPPDDSLTTLRTALNLPFFVAVPVLVGTRCTALIISGRLREQKPFFPPLDEGDLATWQATAGFLGSSLLNSELFARTKRMADSFARFVPREFLQLLGKDDPTDISIGDQTQLEMTILFSDIRGFTTLSEKMSPQQTFDFVNAYLAHAAPIIRQHHGFIDKYIGDAIMALFPRSPQDALTAGIALRQAVESFNHPASPPSSQLAPTVAHLPPQSPPLPFLAPGMPGVAPHPEAPSHPYPTPPLAIGVGVHTGLVMLGTTGYSITSASPLTPHAPLTTDARLDCTVIADAVNLASRLEGLTKYYGCSLIASMDAMQKIPEPDRPEYRLIDRVRVKGKTDPVELLDVFAADPPITRNLKRQTLPEFSAALTQYTQGHLHAAQTLLAAVLEQNPHDKSAQLLAQRITHYQSQGLPPTWTGITQLDAK